MRNVRAVSSAIGEIASAVACRNGVARIRVMRNRQSTKRFCCAVVEAAKGVPVVGATHAKVDAEEAAAVGVKRVAVLRTQLAKG